MPNVTSNMAGTLMSVDVQVGDKVTAGQDVAVLESMKMQMAIQSEVAGTVKAIKSNPGDFVNEGDVILELD